MIIPGRVENGVVVLQDGISLPDGTEVSVVVARAPRATSAERMSDDERRRVLEIGERIASLPDENPGDTFRGTDHDRVLYGKP